MPNAWILMTALPPTKGHADLISFARHLPNVGDLHVVLATQPGEPFIEERTQVIRKSLTTGRKWITTVGYKAEYIDLYRQKIQQVPKDDQDTAFWDLWVQILRKKGLVKGDFIVSSEVYGDKLAEVTDCIHIPYDINRTLRGARATATDVRKDPIGQFSHILPEFQRYLRKTVTLFGAESCGKTTLAQALAEELNSLYVPEYARPFLEHTGPEITSEKMKTIWHGQAALQALKESPISLNKPFIIQDTDLFSTLGYWLMWDHPPDNGLMNDAVDRKSDLYIVCPSNIPFEKDPLRYGGSKRESPDEYWINLCKIFELNYVVLKESDPDKRLAEAKRAMIKCFDPKRLQYERVK